MNKNAFLLVKIQPPKNKIREIRLIKFDDFLNRDFPFVHFRDYAIFQLKTLLLSRDTITHRRLNNMLHNVQDCCPYQLNF